MASPGRGHRLRSGGRRRAARRAGPAASDRSRLRRPVHVRAPALGVRLGGFSRRGGFSSAWNHDYPRAEQHLSLILKELTALDIRTDGSLILTLDDPELFKYPIAFMWEPGFWNLTDREAESFRAYLLKGGFAVFEDFDGAAAVEQLRGADAARAARTAGSSSSTQSHRIFDSFFQIKDIDAIVHPMSRHPPELLRHLRGQRSVEAADGRRQLRQRRARVLGVVGRRDCSRSTRRTKPTSWASTT